MPQAIPVIIGWTQTSILGAIVGGLAKLAAASLLERVLGKNDRQGAPPINVTVNSTVSERRICLGTVRAGGAFVFVATSGTNNKYLWYVIAYAGHQCQALKDLYLDKLKVPAADINGTTGVVSTAALDGKLMCWDHLGTSAQTVDTNLDSAFTEWTSNHRLQGICYRALRLERSDKAWPNGAPQSCNSVLDGAWLYDPRLDSTNGGSGTHRTDDPRTWAFSRNWALGVRWLLSGGSVVNDQATRLIRYGVQASDARIEDAYITAAANISDQSLSGANAPPGGAEVRYTLDGEFACTQTRRDILEEALAAGGPGQLVNLHGKWRLYAGAYDAPTFSYTQDDLHDEIEIDDTDGDETRFNQISGVYIDSEKDYTEQTTVVRSNATYVTQDNSKKIPKTQVSLRCISRQYQAQRVVERMLRDARQMRKVVFPFGRQGMRLAPWETFNYSDTAYGWTNRVFRVLERDLIRNESGGVICKITAKACASSVDTDLATADYTTGTSVTNSLQSEPPDAPTSLTTTSLLHAIQIDYVLGEFWQRNGAVEIYEYTANTPFASASLIATVRGTRAIIAKNDFITRYYWVRVVAIGGQASATEPSGNGLSGVALPSDGITSDPAFVLDTGSAYWWPLLSAGGSPVTPAIAITGGRTGGLATFAPNGALGTSSLISRRKINYEFLDKQQFTVRIRARKSGSWDGTLFATGIPHNQDSSSGTYAPSVSGASYGAVTVLGATLTTSWQEYYALCQCNLTTNAPYMSLSVSAVGGTTGSLEVDFAEMADGFANDIPEVTYTGATNLSSTDLMKRVIYNSGSGGNIRLPAASSDTIGAKVWVEQRGAGLATLTVIGGGVHNILSYPAGLVFSLPMSGQYSTAICECVGATTWRVILQN